MDPTTKQALTYEASKKSLGLAFLFLIFFGGLGFHRFYVGEKRTATAMLIITLVSIFFGFFIIGIWCFVDLFLIPGMVKDYNLNLANSLESE